MRWIGMLAGALFLVWLGLYHQPYYPATWLDEGFVLQGATNLARYSTYAMRSSDGFRVLDQPLLANGPGVVLPIAAAFLVFGDGLLQARLVMAGFMVTTATVFFLVAQRLFGLRSAFVATGLLVALPVVIPGQEGDAAGFVLFGRHALGNVPALTYFLVGYLLWIGARDQKRRWRILAAGILFGMATVTKAQYGLLIPALALVGFLEWQGGRQAGARNTLTLILTVLTCQVVWWGAQVLLVGWGGLDQHFEAIRSSSHVTVLALRPSRIPGNLSYLLRSGLVPVVLPALGYAAWLSWQEGLATSRHLLLVIIVPVWLAWFVFVSVGWPRYAFEPYSLGLLLSGKLMVDGLDLLRAEIRAPQQFNIARVCRLALVALTIVIAVGLGSIGLSQRIWAVVEEPDKSPQEFARYLGQHIKNDAVVESWEWQLDILADLTYHHPTNDWVDRYTAVLQFGEPLTLQYNPLESQPAYLIDGPFSKWTRIYQAALAGGCCTLLFQAGPYDLYLVTGGAAVSTASLSRP